MAEDRVLSGALDGRVYRVIAGSAFSWAYLLVEDRLGERFILDTGKRALSPVTDINAAYGSDGSAVTVGASGPGQQAVSDVTLSVQADGQYTFVIPGDAASELRISSREGSAPPILILTVQP